MTVSYAALTRSGTLSTEGRFDVDVPRLLMHPPARVPCEDPRPCDPRPPVTDMKQGNRHTGGRALVDALGIPRRRHRLPLPGESRLAPLGALCDARGAVATIPCRHEGGAANMAEACGKLTGRPGAVMVTRGPGARHAAAGLHTATARDSAPTVVFIGQVERGHSDREAFQEIEYRRFIAPPCRRAVRIGDPARIPGLVNQAFHRACSGRPGPVAVALPGTGPSAGHGPFAPCRMRPGGGRAARYGTILMHRERQYPDHVIATDHPANPDFVARAESFGAFAARAERTAGFEAALRPGRVALVEPRIDPEPITTRTTLAQVLSAGAGA